MFLAAIPVWPQSYVDVAFPNEQRWRVTAFLSQASVWEPPTQTFQINIRISLFAIRHSMGTQDFSLAHVSGCAHPHS